MYDRARVLEFGCVFYEGKRKEGSSWQKYQTLVRPGADFNVPLAVQAPAAAKHHITQEKAAAEGRPWEEIMPTLKHLIEEADLIVTHNTAFDVHVLASEIFRAGHRALFDTLMRKPKQCTLEASRAYTSTGRVMGLANFYTLLLKKPVPEGLHRALADTMLVVECYFKMRHELHGDVEVPAKEEMREFNVALPATTNEGDTTQEVDDDDEENDDDGGGEEGNPDEKKKKREGNEEDEGEDEVSSVPPAVKKHKAE